MFHVITGSFQPTLESALLDEVQQLKSSDPLAPLAIVVPSDLLRRRMQWLLCVEHQLPLIDVHFLTFHQLALRLYEEQALFNQEESILQIELVQDLFFEHLLRTIAISETSPLSGSPLSGLSAGSWAALWRTIRDLKEATVDPTIILQGIGEGLFEADERDKLQTLFTLYARFLEISKEFNVGSADDLAMRLIPWVARSEFLGRLQRVCYYGSYDLTQVQLSLFEAICQRAQVTVYFPLASDPSFAFARRFFERHLFSGSLVQGKSGAALSPSVAEDGNSQVQQVIIMNTVGADDELTLVCKEILNLVEVHDYSVDDIGIVARSVEPYRSSLRRIFDQHRVPFTSSAEESVIQEPIIKILVQLSSLSLSEFYWRDVLDVLTSPYYRVERLGSAQEAIRPELWHAAIRTIGITRGEDQWKRLDTVLQMSSEANRPTHRDEVQNHITADPMQIRLLNSLVVQLVADCRALPTQGRPGELTEAFVSLIQAHLVFPGLKGSQEMIRDSVKQQDLTTAIHTVFDNLRQLDRVQELVTWEEWTRLFKRALQTCGVPIGSGNHHGVRVLDAMSARGLSFRAVFLLGMNEKGFPRVIQEDAFLRDRHRRVLGETFGYKIDEKLAGYDEERLLFALLKHATRQRLYLVYQRADRDGRPLAPSPYLTEFQPSDLVTNPIHEVAMPRRFSDRIDHPLFGSTFLTREEFGLKLIFQGFDPSSVLHAAEPMASLFRNGWSALKRIERPGRRLGLGDGLIGSVDDYWRQVAEKGITPTSLEMYARCPFQYSAKHVLRVRSMRPPIIDELPTSSIGELCHRVLQLSYRKFLSDGWPEQELTPASIEQTIAAVGEEVFTEYAVSHAIGYFLTWQLTKNIIVRLVHHVVEADQQAYRDHGFRPVAFEVDAEGSIVGLGSKTDSLKIRGRLDRVDQRSHPPGIRVVDYKYQSGSRMKSQHRDLFLSGIRGLHLQPPLYTRMTDFHNERLEADLERHPIQAEGVDFIFLAPSWEIPVVRSEFESASWKGSTGQQLQKTLRMLVNGIHAGRFFILPGEYCKFCEFSTACRLFHSPTLQRLRGAPQARELRQLRKQDVPHA